MGITHSKVSAKSDGADSSLVLPSDWNANHTVGSSTFPVSPTTNEIYFRTDYGMWFQYDGTRWLSTTYYEINPTTVHDNISTTTEVGRWALQPPPVGTDIWLISFSNTFTVASGGTALSSSHKWVITLSKYSGASSTSVTGTHSIASGASGQWRSDAATSIGELLGTYYLITATATKTGTPGNLYYYGIMNYKIVAT